MTFEVYIHVPFCLRRCGYCDFNTYTAVDLGGGASRGNYARMAIAEMRLARRWQLDQGIVEPAASTVFFGGGTPTVLPARDLVAMLDAVRDIWGIEDGAEITTEANPDTVDEASIRELADGGFTRISFGMQSAVPSVLRVLDRTHTPANVEAGVHAADACGLRSSVDLIYGAPGESMEDWRTSVRAALDLGVSHVSAYALTVEPTTTMGRRIAAGRLASPDDDDEAAKYEAVDDMLSAAGLHWYEISNWARPGYESRHNLGYWRNADWAGIGPGAHSHYGRPGDGLRAWDIAHPRQWGLSVSAGRIPWNGSERLGASEILEETVMLGIRLSEGLGLARVAALAGHGVPSMTLSRLADEGLAQVLGDRLIPTRRGRLLNDAIAQEILDALDSGTATAGTTENTVTAPVPAGQKDPAADPEEAITSQPRWRRTATTASGDPRRNAV
ncbi:radical SAM family heme chaperone HemW [uncultured Bifidobacterium sp.]|uniref:radical SAM family heme chaperone HemW n=1 Tax=uncultured Bifidobacterium sp. TaxID=165187 RepID=UPI0028DD0DDF|nr:radical SAM family heme chaperone HemW [uncultured Bifidobacterium sp.]